MGPFAIAQVFEYLGPVDPMTLSTSERLELARLTGAVEFWSIGAGRHGDRDEALDDLLGITRDGLVWAMALGNALARIDAGPTGCRAAVDLLKAMAPDPAAVAEHREWARARLTRFGGI